MERFGRLMSIASPCRATTSNVSPVVEHVADFAAAAHAKNSLLLCDAVQGYGRVAIPDGPDLIAISAHKIHGPKGIGALWVKDGVDLPPLMFGGAKPVPVDMGRLRSPYRDMMWVE